MKIMWLSNAPWVSTGYGNQTRLFVPRIQAQGHQVAVTAFYGLEGGILDWNGVPVYPKAWHPYGQDIVGAHCGHFGADILITLIDAWVMEPHLYGPHVRWCPWYPIDMDPAPPPVANKVRSSYSPICYSKYGLQKSAEAGIEAAYVPHGVDCSAFRPLDRKAARDALKLPQDRFIVGMVAANKGTPSRKALPQSFEAFALFRKEHPEAMLYVHSCMGKNGENGGVNLLEMAKFVGLGQGDILFADQYVNHVGFPEPHMVALYNAFDVLLAASMGEGFGIPILEAQSCGCPVITGDWTSMPEITFGGWKVALEDADRFWTPLGAYQFLPRIGAIKEALAEAYRGATARVRSGAREGALEYDADLVAAKFWKPYLAELEGRISAGAGELQLVKFGEGA